MKLRAICLTIVLGLIATGSALAEVAPSQDNQPPWRFSLRPYMFLSGLSGSVTADPVTIPINSGFNDLLKNLQIGGFLAFTAEKDRWGIYSDFQYISLLGKGSSSLDAELELDNLIFETDVTYRPASAPTLQFLAGVRIYSIDQRLTIKDQPLQTANTTVVDPILGAHGEWQLGRNWDFELRGDVGGFGISSESTYQVLALFHWKIKPSFSIPFGYRVLGYQIKTGGVRMNTRMSGLVLGLDFRF